MSLAVYSKPEDGAEYTALSPFTVTFDGRLGGAQDHKVYIRNNDAQRWYSSIALQAVDTYGTSTTDGSLVGYNWKIAEGEDALSLEEWEAVNQGNQLSLSDSLGTATEGDIVTYLPVWIRVTVPGDLPLQTITDMVLRITATEGYIA